MWSCLVKKVSLFAGAQQSNIELWTKESVCCLLISHFPSCQFYLCLCLRDALILFGRCSRRLPVCLFNCMFFTGCLLFFLFSHGLLHFFFPVFFFFFGVQASLRFFRLTRRQLQSPIRVVRGDCCDVTPSWQRLRGFRCRQMQIGHVDWVTKCRHPTPCFIPGRDSPSARQPCLLGPWYGGYFKTAAAMPSRHFGGFDSLKYVGREKKQKKKQPLMRHELSALAAKSLSRNQMLQVWMTRTCNRSAKVHNPRAPLRFATCPPTDHCTLS